MTLYVRTKLSYMSVSIYVIYLCYITLYVRAKLSYMSVPNYVTYPCQIKLYVRTKHHVPRTENILVTAIKAVKYKSVKLPDSRTVGRGVAHARFH
jgi:hypothetical protein